MNEMAARRNRFFNDVAAAVAHSARELGVANDVAEQLGNAAADQLAQEWAGQMLSIPMDHYYKLAKRDMQILADHHAGDSVPTLAKRYGLGQRAMYKLLTRAQRRARARQVDMFAEAQA